MESEAKLLKTCKGEAIKDVLKLGVDGFFFEAEGGGEFSSAPKFSLDILCCQFSSFRSVVPVFSLFSQ